MGDFVRVKDPSTGHEYTTAAPVEGLTVIDKDAVDRFGRVLPPKHNTSKSGRSATTSKESDK